MTREQLRGAGFTETAIRWHAGRGWRVLLPGVFLLNRNDPRPRQRLVAGLLGGGERSVLSGAHRRVASRDHVDRGRATGCSWTRSCTPRQPPRGFAEVRRSTAASTTSVSRCTHSATRDCRPDLLGPPHVDAARAPRSARRPFGDPHRQPSSTSHRRRASPSGCVASGRGRPPGAATARRMHPPAGVVVVLPCAELLAPSRRRGRPPDRPGPTSAVAGGPPPLTMTDVWFEQHLAMAAMFHRTAAGYTPLATS